MSYVDQRRRSSLSELTDFFESLVHDRESRSIISKLPTSRGAGGESPASGGLPDHSDGSEKNPEDVKSPKREKEAARAAWSPTLSARRQHQRGGGDLLDSMQVTGERSGDDPTPPLLTEDLLEHLADLRLAAR